MRWLTLVAAAGNFTRPAAATRRLVVTATASADVLAGTEYRTVDLHQLLDAQLWHVLHDTSSPARAGCALAVRRSRVRVLRHGWALGTRPRLGRRRARMMTRWLLWADIEVDHRDRRRAIVGHFPPKRYFWLWPGMLARLRRLVAASPYPVLVCADWNKRSRAVQRATRLRTRLAGTIVGWAFSRGQRTRRAHTRRVPGFDHPLVVVDLLLAP